MPPREEDDCAPLAVLETAGRIRATHPVLADLLEALAVPRNYRLLELVIGLGGASGATIDVTFNKGRVQKTVVAPRVTTEY